MEITHGRRTKGQGDVGERGEWHLGTGGVELCVALFRADTPDGIAACDAAAHQLYGFGLAKARFILSTEWCQAELSDRELTEAEEQYSPAGCMWACTMPGSLCQSPPRHCRGDVMPAQCDLSANKGWSLCWAAGIKSREETFKETYQTDKNSWPHFQHISFAQFNSPDFLLWFTSTSPCQKKGQINLIKHHQIHIFSYDR